eukprot:2302099-Amphidinium_carterae.1
MPRGARLHVTHPGFTESVHGYLDEVLHLRALAASRSQAARSRAYTTWKRRSAEQGGKLVRAAVKTASPGMVVAVIDAEERYLTDPQQVVQEFARYWGSKWCRAEVHTMPALEVPHSSVDPLQLAELAKKLPKGKANGPDGWAVSDFARFSGSSWQSLAALLSAFEQHGWPEVLTTSLTVFLHKSLEAQTTTADKYRPITLLSQIYRLYARLRLLQHRELLLQHQPVEFRAG